jgi:hypothetical protein
VSSTRPRVTVVLFIDALGRCVADTHEFLRDAPGRAYTLETVIGYSSSAIPSLLTGELPRVHGHFSMYRRDGGDGVFRRYRLLLELVQRTRGRGKIRRFLKKRLSRRIDGYFELYDIPLGVLSLLDLPQRHDIFAPGGVPPHETFIDRIHTSGLSHRIWTWRDDEERAFAELEQDLRMGRSEFLMLYSARLDALMHRVGTRDAAVRDALGAYEKRLESIREAAGASELHLYVFSDHGMTDVCGVHDVHARLASSGLEAPGDYLFFTDSTMARFWFPDEGARARVREVLPDTSWGRWLTREEIETYGIDFADHRFGEEIFLLEAGHVIAPSFMGVEACAAMHGYGPEDATAAAFLHADPAPAVAPRSILDLHALFCAEVTWLQESAP